MIKSIRFFLLSIFVVAVTVAVLWYFHLPVPVVASNLAQVELEAANGGYRLMDVKSLSKLYQKDLRLVDFVDPNEFLNRMVALIPY